jgi:hypothetical protein
MFKAFKEAKNMNSMQLERIYNTLSKLEKAIEKELDNFTQTW